MKKNILDSERSFWRLLLIVSGTISFLKGIQLPSVVPATQAQLDYSVGLIRRGLFGTIAEYLHIPIYHYDVFAVIAFAILGAFFLVLVYAIWRTRLTRTQLGLLACTVFFSSYAVTYTASLVGRFDIIQMAMALLVVSIRRPVLRNAILLVVSPLCILLHENFFVAFLPICLLPTAMEMIVGHNTRRMDAGVLLGVAALGSSTITVMMIAAVHYPHPEALKTLYGWIGARVDFQMDDAVVGILDRGMASNASLMARLVWSPGFRWIDLWFSLLTFVPSAIFLILFAWKTLDGVNAGRARLTVVALIVCVMSPLALNAFGADMDRWNTFMLFNSFVAVLAVSRLAIAHKAPLPAAAPRWTHAAILLVATNLACGGGLLEDKAITPYPFRTHVLTLFNTLAGHPPAKPTLWKLGG